MTIELGLILMRIFLGWTRHSYSQCHWVRQKKGGRVFRRQSKSYRALCYTKDNLHLPNRHERKLLVPIPIKMLSQKIIRTQFNNIFQNTSIRKVFGKPISLQLHMIFFATEQIINKTIKNLRNMKVRRKNQILIMP